MNHEVRYIRNFWTRALVVFVMLALGTTVVTGAFSNPRAGVVFVEEEMGSSKLPLVEEKIESKDKPDFLKILFSSVETEHRMGRGSHGSPRAGYGSLPEIPPDFS